MASSNRSNKWIIDTNVPVAANYAMTPEKIGDDLMFCCVEKCIKTLEEIIKSGVVVIDNENEVFAEYHKHLSLKGQPGMGDKFMKWLHDRQWTPTHVDRVHLHKDGSDYVDFPQQEGLLDFDPSDKKFVALAVAHKERPPILQALDSKWWGWKDSLLNAGVTVTFLCSEYIEKKYAKKMEH